MTNRKKGLIITALGVLFVVPDSLFVRLIDSDPMIIAFWRGAVAGSLILVALLVSNGISAFKPVFNSGFPGILYIILIGSTTPAFVFAVTYTSVANVVFIFATIPIFALFFSYFFLGEAIQLSTVLTSIVVFLGLAIIAYGSGSSEISSWQGDLFAVYVSAAYAGALTALRKLKEISMVPAIPIAYIGTALIISLFYSPFEEFDSNGLFFVGHGLFIGIATWLLTLGPRYLSSPEVSLLILLESVLAPLLVWFVVGEFPGEWALVGGAIVISTLLVFNLLKLWGEKNQKDTKYYTKKEIKRNF